MSVPALPANFNEQYRKACDDEARAMKTLEALRKKRFHLEAMIPLIRTGPLPQIRADLPP